MKPATLSELAEIVTAMPERRRLMVQLAAWCGLRFGELAELRRKDLDLRSRVIKVRRSVVRAKVDSDEESGRQAIVKASKTDAGVRDVPIPPHLLDDVRAHLRDHAEEGRDGLLFPGRAGHHLTTSSFYGRESTFRKDNSLYRTGHGWFEARRLAGRPDLHFHDLRHTGLTNAAVAGATMAELMALAGHSTPGAAMRYSTPLLTVCKTSPAGYPRSLGPSLATELARLLAPTAQRRSPPALGFAGGPDCCLSPS